MPSPSPVRVFSTYATFPTLIRRNRDARHRLRRVPRAGRRAELFLRWRLCASPAFPSPTLPPAPARPSLHRATFPQQAARRRSGDQTTASARRSTSVRRANCNFRAFFTRRLTARFRLRSFHVVARRHGDAAEHVEREHLRGRPLRVDALVQRRDEVAREACAPRPPTNCSYCVSICAPCSALRPRRSPSPPLTFSGNPDRDRVESQSNRPCALVREAVRRRLQTADVPLAARTLATHNPLTCPRRGEPIDLLLRQ